MHGYSLDPHPSVKIVSEQYAVVRIPRIKRGCVPARGNSSPDFWGGFASLQVEDTYG